MLLCNGKVVCLDNFRPKNLERSTGETLLKTTDKFNCCKCAEETCPNLECPRTYRCRHSRKYSTIDLCLCPSALIVAKQIVGSFPSVGFLENAPSILNLKIMDGYGQSYLP